MDRSCRLDVIGISKPCTADWDRMSGDDRVRFCGLCRKNVYHLSAMPEQEALDLIRRNEGKMCVRLFRRQDGTVVSGDCGAVAEGQETFRRGMRRIAAAVILLFLMGWGGLRASKSGDIGEAAVIRRMRSVPVVGGVINRLWPLAPRAAMGEMVCPTVPNPAPTPVAP